MKNIEIWKDIQGYEQFYQVSNYGRIRSKGRSFKREKYIHVYKPKILSCVKQKSHNYLTIRLNDGIQTKGYLVHRLVAINFIENHDNRPQVNHKDANTLNNNLNNLEWCTPSENVKHSFKLNNIDRKGENNHRNKLKEKDVINIKKRILYGERNIDISKIYKVTPATISDIKNKKLWKHVII